MIPLKLCRRIEVLVGDQWQPAHLEQIEAGDVIRMFEPGTDEPIDHPMTGIDQTISELPSFTVLTKGELKAQEIYKLKGKDVAKAISLAEDFVQEAKKSTYSTALLSSFIDELSKYMTLPIQKDAIPAEVYLALLELTIENRKFIDIQWYNLCSSLLDLRLSADNELRVKALLKTRSKGFRGD